MPFSSTGPNSVNTTSAGSEGSHDILTDQHLSGPRVLPDLRCDIHQRLSANDLHSYARVLDLDLDLFGKGLAEHVHADLVHEDFLSGVRSGVNGTPTSFINGLHHDDSYESETLLMARQRAAELGEED